MNVGELFLRSLWWMQDKWERGAGNNDGPSVRLEAHCYLTEPGGADPCCPGVPSIRVLGVHPNGRTVPAVATDAEVIAPASARVDALAGHHQHAALQVVGGVADSPPRLA